MNFSSENYPVTLEICHACCFFHTEVKLATQNMDVGHIKKLVCFLLCSLTPLAQDFIKSVLQLQRMVAKIMGMGDDKL